MISEKIALANLPTPIQKLERLSKQIGKDIFVWRDDLNGFLESGNKIRKLEYVLADAGKQKATWLVTCGGPQSNHARATAIAARRMGLGVTLVIRQPKNPSLYGDEITGNLLLDKIFGAQIVSIPYDLYQKRGGVYDSFLAEAAEAIRSRGERPYLVPEGASNPLGCLGYLNGVEEMLSTWKKVVGGDEGPDSLFVALGSGGTHAGLVMGYDRNELGREKVFAINVCDDRAYFEKRVGDLIELTVAEFSLKDHGRKVQILDGHLGGGYAVVSDEELAFYAEIAQSDGLLLDPVYTGKAFRGMLAEIKKDPARFGKKVLFLHSGGLFATFAYGRDYLRAIGADASGSGTRK